MMITDKKRMDKLEKIIFETEDGEEEFTVIADTKLQGKNYILLTDSPDNDEEGSFLVLRDNSSAGDEYASYEEIEDEEELSAVIKVFNELLDDIDLEV